MNSAEDGFIAHLNGDVTSLCHCWRLERRDGRVMGFTDHDVGLVIDGRAYEPHSGLARSEATGSLGMAIDMMDVQGALTSDDVSEADIAAGLYDRAKVTTLLVNWQKPQEHSVVAQAVIGRLLRQDGMFVAELESLARHLDRPNGRHIRRLCDATLGDMRCRARIDGEAFTAHGTIVQELGAGHYVVDGLDGYAPGWFAHGALTWMSGLREGETVRVGDHRRQTMGVVIAIADGARAATGDAFIVKAGCDKRFETCRTKFANTVNFRGFPHLPGNDAAYAYVSEGRQFDGGVLVE